MNERGGKKVSYPLKTVSDSVWKGTVAKDPMDNTITRSCAVTSHPHLLHSMMTGETSKRIEIQTIATPHHARIHARTPYPRVTVYDEVLPVVLGQKLTVEIKGAAGADPDAHNLSIMHPVPSSVYQKILSILGGARRWFLCRSRWRRGW